MEIIRSAIAIPYRHDTDKVLMLRRRLDDRSYPGSWCFPGGRCDSEDHSTERTALRELREETDLTAMNILPFHKGSSVLERRNRKYVIEAFRVLVVGEVVLSDEHIEAKWVTPKEGLELDLSGPFTKELLEKMEKEI